MHRRALYSELAGYYDKIYWDKDYAREAEFLFRLLRKNRVTGKRILEVGCGTGNHTKILTARGYQVTAVDLSEDILKIARKKVKRGARFVQGDMRNLDAAVEGEFDAVICLFSTISYNVNASELKKTLRGFYRHVKQDGIVAFDTHFTRKGFLDGYRGEDIFDDGRIIGARLSTSRLRRDVGEITFTYLIKDGPKVITLRNDIHRLGLFNSDDVLKLLSEVGFKRMNLYSDWTFRRGRDTASFKDKIFVGRKSY